MEGGAKYSCSGSDSDIHVPARARLPFNLRTSPVAARLLCSCCAGGVLRAPGCCAVFLQIFASRKSTFSRKTCKNAGLERFCEKLSVFAGSICTATAQQLGAYLKHRVRPAERLYRRCFFCRFWRCCFFCRFWRCSQRRFCSCCAVFLQFFCRFWRQAPRTNEADSRAEDSGSIPVSGTFSIAYT